MQNMFFMSNHRHGNHSHIHRKQNNTNNVIAKRLIPFELPPNPLYNIKREEYIKHILKSHTNIKNIHNDYTGHIVTITYNNPYEKYIEIMRQNKKIETNEKVEKYFWEYDINDTPLIWVSMLVPSYNTKQEFLIECIDSIKAQVGHFGLELVWINDGSTPENTKILEYILNEKFQSPPINHFKLVYHNNVENKGIRYTLHKGVLMCTNEIVMRFDSDDIMLKDRIITQIVYMLQNPDCIICGADVYEFTTENNDSSNKNKKIINYTNFSPVLTWKDFLEKKNVYYTLSHPTFCFRKNKILEAGNYNKDFEHNFEDFELLLRLLKKYNQIHNIVKPLVLYRSHEMQITKMGGSDLFKKIIEYVKNIVENA
jgi:hypothetical protein